jgi:hypothetical protein
MGAKSEGLKELAADLQKAADEVEERGKRIVGQGCNNIKKQAQRTIRAASHRGYLPHYPRALGYEVRSGGGSIIGVVGADPAKLQGGLGDLLEYGSQNNAPIPHTNPALDAEVPRFERYVAELGESLIAGQTPPAGGPVTDPGGG